MRLLDSLTLIIIRNWVIDNEIIDNSGSISDYINSEMIENFYKTKYFLNPWSLFKLTDTFTQFRLVFSVNWLYFN